MASGNSKKNDISILYVEDDESTVIFMNSILRNRYKHVLTAENGKRGLELFQNNSHKIDLVITDISMPEIDGFSMLREMKKIKPSLFSIIASSHFGTEEMLSAIELGVNYFVIKPFEAEKVEKSLAHVHDQITMHRENERLEFEQLKSHLNRQIDEKLDEFAENFSIPIVITDDRGRIIEKNALFRELFVEDSELGRLLASGDGNLHRFFHEHPGCFTAQENEEWLKRFYFTSQAAPVRVRLESDSLDMLCDVTVQTLLAGEYERYVFYFNSHRPVQRTEYSNAILIADEQEVAKRFLIKALEPLQFSIFEVNDLDDLIEKAVDIQPLMILFDPVMSGREGIAIIEQLKRIPETRYTPIVVVTSLEDPAFKKQCVRAGVTTFINKPFHPENVRKKAKAILKNFLNLENNIKRFVFALEFQRGCKIAAEHIAALGRILVRRLKISDHHRGYLLFGLRFLACMKDWEDVESNLQFARIMRLPDSFINLIEESRNPVNEEARILKLLWEAHKAYKHDRGAGRLEVAECPDELCQNAMLFYREKTHPVYSGVDVSNIMQVYCTDIDEMKDCDFNRMDLFFTIIENCLTHQLIYGEGGMAYLKHESDKHTFVFEPHVLGGQNIEAILETLHSFEHDIFIYLGFHNEHAAICVELEKRDDSSLGLTSKPEPSDVWKESVEEEFFDFSNFGEPDNGAVSGPKRIVSAREFIAENEVDMEDIENLRHLEHDILDSVSDVESAPDKGVILTAAAGYFKSYGANLMYVSEFRDLSDAMIAMGDAFERVDYTRVDQSILQLMPSVFEKMANEMKGWREAVFTRKDAEDVHYWDKSIIADLEQCISFIQSSNTESDSIDEDTLFF